jgi:cell division transport system permease protein
VGEDFLGVLGTNPLSANIQVGLRPEYANADSLAWIAEHLKQDARVEEVAYNPNVVRNMDNAFQRAWLVLGLAAGLLLVVAIALINNTVRLAIYSRRFLIRTMHLVGATPWFIKRPFLVQSLMQGLVAAVLAIGLLTAMIQVCIRFLPDLGALVDMLAMATVFAGTIALGILIALCSTWFAVRRYLRMNIDELNWS